MLICGLLLFAFNSTTLSFSIAPTPRWIRDDSLISTNFVWLTYVALRLWGYFRNNSDIAVSRRDKLIDYLVYFLFAGPAILKLWLVKQPWTGLVLGIIYAIAFFGIGRIVRRPVYLTAAVWCVAGFIHWAFFAPREPLSLFFITGGVVTAAQGAWELIRSSRVQPTPSAPAIT
jgi:hypothetical protein